MYTAKIIRHRHKFYHYMNGDLKSVKEETYFKIVFSEPSEMDAFRSWCELNGGNYDYDKVNSCQRGSLPKIEIFLNEICWCDLMSYYLLHVAGYKFYSVIQPYKGEIYVRE